MKIKPVVAMTALVAFGAEAHCGEVPGFEEVALDMPHRETVVRGAILSRRMHDCAARDQDRTAAGQMAGSGFRAGLDHPCLRTHAPTGQC